MRKLGPEFLAELLGFRAALGPLIGQLAAQRSLPEDVEALRAALVAVQVADSAAARQAADLGCFRVLIPGTGNRAPGLLYRWVEHEPTCACDDAEAVGADVRVITEAVLARDAAAAAAVEAYMQASAPRMVLSYSKNQSTSPGPPPRRPFRGVGLIWRPALRGARQ